jgi:septal ring factor EnvC (AmiA/AmiB activator)
VKGETPALVGKAFFQRPGRNISGHSGRLFPIAFLLGVLALSIIDLRGVETTAPARDADLQRIRREISGLRQKLESLHTQTRSAEQELESVELELAIRTRELQLAVELQTRLEEQQRGVRAAIDSLSPRIAEQKRDLAKRLVALYRLGGLSYIRMLLSIDRRQDPLEAVSMLSYLVGRDSRAVTRFQATRQQLASQFAELADKEQRIARMRAVVEDRRTAVARAHDEKGRLLASLRSEGSQSEQKLADLEEKARRLERLFGHLYRQGPSSGKVADVREFRGALGWPVRGRLLETFGRQRNAKFSTVTMSNGLKIEAPPGSEVHAVFQGTVLFSQWFKGYGNLIILDHGNRVFSLYGNLKGPAVAVGDQVASGQAIAGVSEAEEPAAGYLYFEIRNDNKPEDPQKWLR